MEAQSGKFDEAFRQLTKSQPLLLFQDKLNNGQGKLLVLTTATNDCCVSAEKPHLASVVAWEMRRTIQTQ